MISSQWSPIISGQLDDITGYYIDNSGVGKSFIASPSCKNIKITPDVANLINVTPGTISVAGIKMPATICAVNYN